MQNKQHLSVYVKQSSIKCNWIQMFDRTKQQHSVIEVREMKKSYSKMFSFDCKILAWSTDDPVETPKRVVSK